MKLSVTTVGAFLAPTTFDTILRVQQTCGGARDRTNNPQQRHVAAVGGRRKHMPGALALSDCSCFPVALIWLRGTAAGATSGVSVIPGRSC
jgi:hypothetical protein